MRFAIIVQARLGSTRLPGKVLSRLGVKTMLRACLDRCAQTPKVDEVVCAVPTGAADDPVAAEASRAGYAVHRGSSGDVLARYAGAARAARADVVMRVTSDCPLIDPDVCGQVRDALLETFADYACNNMPPSFPHGLDCDVFPAERLYDAEWLAREAYDREHVTPWLRRDPHLRRVALEGPGGEAARLRWTLDYPEDATFFDALWARLGDSLHEASWRSLAAACAEHPEVVRLNARHIDEARLSAPATSLAKRIAYRSPTASSRYGHGPEPSTHWAEQTA